jgi:hypothetical protein
MKEQGLFFKKILNGNNINSKQTNFSEKNYFDFLIKNNIFITYYPFANINFKKKYKNLFFRSVIKNQYIRDELFSLLSNYDDKIILLKGISLFETIYSENLNRHLSDVDVYVSDYDSFKEYLIAAGYKQVGDYPEGFRKNNIKIDIHTDLINKNRNIFQSKIININDKNLIFNNLISIHKNIFRLNNEFEYLYLIAHIFIHHNLSNIKWLTDIFIYNKNMAINNKKLINLLNITGVNELFIFFEKLYNNYLTFSISDKRNNISNLLFFCIANNRYAIHFYFLKGLKIKILYFFFIINYLLKRKSKV